MWIYNKENLLIKSGGIYVHCGWYMWIGIYGINVSCFYRKKNKEKIDKKNEERICIKVCLWRHDSALLYGLRKQKMNLKELMDWLWLLYIWDALLAFGLPHHILYFFFRTYALSLITTLLKTFEFLFECVWVSWDWTDKQAYGSTISHTEFESALLIHLNIWVIRENPMRCLPN